MELKIYTVDAFTEEPFKGNPAGVCLLENELPDHTLQNIATEMNLSETAFLFPLTENGWRGGKFSLRWFTPLVEVPLCGHATLASAHILFNEIRNRMPKIDFKTKSGSLYVERSKANHLIMDFPLDHADRIHSIPEIITALKLDESKIIQFSLSKIQDYLVIELENESSVKKVYPDFKKLKEFSKIPLGGVILTSMSSLNQDYDFVSRFFTPWFGINEDPVTGSAHTVLASYWSKLGKKSFKAKQISQRGGQLEVEILEKSRVLLKGVAKTILTGTIITQ